MLNSAPTIEQLLPLLESTELEVAIFEENLQRLQAVGECQLDPEEVKKKRVEMQRVEKVYLRRKKQFTEFWATIAENYEGRKQDLWVSSWQSDGRWESTIILTG